MEEKIETTYFTGKPCKRGHIAPRWKVNWTCVECGKLPQIKYRQENKEKIKAVHKEWRQANPTRLAGYLRRWRNENRTHYRQSVRRYSARPEVRARLNALSSKRRALLKKAMPDWVNLKLLSAIYSMAKSATLNTGIDYEVDHIVPLKHSNVCGLHVPWNLQIIPAAANRIKSNKFICEEL